MAEGCDGSAQSAFDILNDRRRAAASLVHARRERRWTGVFPVLLFFAGLAAAVCPGVLRAQELTRTWLTWRTIETAHFAFHYPVELEAWTESIATRMESIDSTVSRLVGSTPSHRVDIVVDNPYAEANGSAWPFINAPAIIFWAEPPTPREEIGEFNVWGQLLASHEFAHIAHLTRPSRNHFDAAVAKLLPVDVGPLALDAPRWVMEGFATYIEGKSTGSGRPNSTWRATILRQWAIEGRLPPYSELDETDGFYGGTGLYLAGSAYLEWLVQRDGDSSLVHLWRRMSARQERTFDEAFIGVFGETPAYLYGRFVAELTGKALAAERQIDLAPPDTGQLIQHLSWETGDPAISIDGARVALVLRAGTLPPRTVIWKTATGVDTGAAGRRAQLLKRDPEDVPARSIYPTTKRAIATLYAVGNLAYQDPRFLHDGRLLVWRNTAQGDGSYAPDLYLWDPDLDRVTRVTDGAAVKEADPSPDGSHAVAVQCRSGYCDLVQVNLTSGAVTTLSGGSPERSFYRPRYSANGSAIVVSVHEHGRWRLALTSDRPSFPLPVPDFDPGANLYDASFIDSSTLVAVSDRGGITNLERIDITTGALRTLTRVTGAAVAPAPNPTDKSIWFLSLHARGYDVRKLLPTSAGDSAPVTLPKALAPVVPERAPDTTSYAVGPVSTPRPYGLGPRRWFWVPAAEAGADGTSANLSLTNSDVVGQSELLAQGGLGSPGSWRGGSATLTYRGFRPDVALSGFSIQQDPTRGANGSDRRDSLDATLTGIAALVDADHRVETNRESLWLGASTATIDGGGDPSRNQTIAFAKGLLGFTTFGGDGSETSGFVSANATVGRTPIGRLSRVLGSAGLDVTDLLPIPLSVRLAAGHVTSSDPFEQFALGGLPPTMIDPALFSQRIAMPALPSGIAEGNSLVSYRIAVPIGVTPYLWGGRVWDRGDVSAWHRVAGIEWGGDLPTFPVLGTPAVRGTFGVGRSLDAPFAHLTQAYVTITFGDWQ